MNGGYFVSNATAILLALRVGPTHGKEILRRLAALTSGTVQMPEGSVYATLIEMRRAKLIHMREESGVRLGAPRKVYSLTEKGEERCRVVRTALLDLAGV